MTGREAEDRRRGLVLFRDDREVAILLDGLSADQREQVERVVADAYAAGERDSEDRSSRFVARCVAALVGLPMPDGRAGSRAMLGRLRSLLSPRG
jgi:hypothetical protein